MKNPGRYKELSPDIHSRKYHNGKAQWKGPIRDWSLIMGKGGGGGATK